MADVSDLPPAQLRCFALVGQFLQGWGTMEIALNGAIGAGLKIEEVQTAIVCANITFRDKIDIVRTLVDVSTFSDRDKASAKSKLRKLGNHARRRNMVAHTAFGPTFDGTGVEFYAVKAKGEYDRSRLIWSAHKFREESRALEGYATFLRSLRDCFARKPLAEVDYVSALRPFLDTGFNMGMLGGWNYLDRPAPTQQIDQTGLAGPPIQPRQDRPGSDPATRERTPRKPGEPPEGGR